MICSSWSSWSMRSSSGNSIRPRGITKVGNSELRHLLYGYQINSDYLTVKTHLCDESHKKAKWSNNIFGGFLEAAAGYGTAVAIPIGILIALGQLIAITLVAELGDFSRFSNPEQLMAFLGLVPGEYSSGNSIRPRGITKVGNSELRHLLYGYQINSDYLTVKPHLCDESHKKAKWSNNIQFIPHSLSKRTLAAYTMA